MVWGAYHLHGKPENSSWKIKWYASFHLEYLLLKLWASGQSDPFLLLLLRFTADVHTFCVLFVFCKDKLNHSVFMPKISLQVVCINGKHP